MVFIHKAQKIEVKKKLQTQSSSTRETLQTQSSSTRETLQTQSSSTEDKALSFEKLSFEELEAVVGGQITPPDSMCPNHNETLVSC